MDDLVVFVEEPSVMRLKNGMVYIEDRSGDKTFRRVMSIHTLMANHLSAEGIIAEWRLEHGNVVSLHAADSG